MPASMAAGGMSSARWRLRTTRCLFSLEHGASVTPQLPITTLVIPCQHDEVPSGSQKICASMCVWPSMKPGATTWPSASMTSRARSRMRPIAAMRPCRTPTSARYRGSPDPSMTAPFLITRSYGIAALLGTSGQRHGESDERLALALGPVRDLHRLLVGIEPQRLLGLDVAAGDANEERVVAVLDRVDVTHRERGGVAG